MSPASFLIALNNVRSAATAISRNASAVERSLATHGYVPPLRENADAAAKLLVAFTQLLRETSLPSSITSGGT
ncbi:hypothetical protein DL95DRAFT_384544 [Leptodontidium sp. 2 PMI_412]|nr:hypothetical protein DL95DRAFT_384544 [Leptodontidium sp. 2 PMI_412]